MPKHRTAAAVIADLPAFGGARSEVIAALNLQRFGGRALDAAQDPAVCRPDDLRVAVSMALLGHGFASIRAALRELPIEPWERTAFSYLDAAEDAAIRAANGGE